MTVHRPWESYTMLEEETGHEVKRISLDPGEKLSLQMHQHRNENWVIVKDTALLTRGDDQVTLQIGNSKNIPRSTKHRLEHLGNTNLEIIEVQDGDYLGEDDIVRFDDKYDRLI